MVVQIIRRAGKLLEPPLQEAERSHKERPDRRRHEKGRHAHQEQFGGDGPIGCRADLVVQGFQPLQGAKGG